MALYNENWKALRVRMDEDVDGEEGVGVKMDGWMCRWLDGWWMSISTGCRVRQGQAGVGAQAVLDGLSLHSIRLYVHINVRGAYPFPPSSRLPSTILRAST